MRNPFFAPPNGSWGYTSWEAYLVAGVLGLIALFLASLLVSGMVRNKGRLDLRLACLSAAMGFGAAGFFVLGRYGDGWPADRPITFCLCGAFALMLLFVYWPKADGVRGSTRSGGVR